VIKIMVDKKAIKILFKRYWSSVGWTDTNLTRDELEYAKAAGVMFDQREFSHDDIIKQVNIIVNTLSLKEIADQFIASLSTRRLDLRSALGSYIVGKYLIDHEFTGDENQCTYCGTYNKEREIEDLNVLNFERFKWGGIRHLYPLYIAFDLEQYSRTEKLVPTSEDYEILNRIFMIINEFPHDGKIRDLEKAIAKVLKSNKEEREILLQIFGFCSILSTNDYPGFINDFIPFVDREVPDHYKNDWSYPVCWWKGRNRLNKNAVKVIFPEFPIN
jgi:hypothetical protein